MSKFMENVNRFRKFFANLQEEIRMTESIPLYKMSSKITERTQVMERLSAHITMEMETLGGWCSADRLESGAREALTITRELVFSQEKFLAGVGPMLLKGKIGKLENSFLRGELSKYWGFVKKEEHPLSEMIERFTSLHQQIEETLAKQARERITLMLSPRPATPKPDRKNDKRLRDQEIRNKMKGTAGGGGRMHKRA